MLYLVSESLHLQKNCRTEDMAILTTESESDEA